MKKLLLCFLIAYSLILVSCMDKQDSDIKRIEDAVTHFYDSGYDYTEKILSYKNGSVVSEEIIEGQVLKSPYREHAKRISSPDKRTWDEIYYSDSASYVLTDGKLQKTHLQLSKPFGYEKKLTFKEPRETTLDGKKVLSYDAEYTIDIGKSYGIREELKAVIKQEYFLDPETNIVLKIKTDFSEQYKINSIALSMSADQMSYEEAVKAWNENGNYQNIEELYIYNYRNPTKFDMPEDS